MKIINQHLGLPVICLETSERVGDVLRFVIDQVTGQIAAVAVTRQWYREPSGVTFADCSAFGQNVVLVNKAESLQPLSAMEGVSLHLEASNEARQRTAITEGGQLLGAVTDEAFDEATGVVSHYRLDLFADAGTGRTLYIPRSTFVTASASVVILKDDVLDFATVDLAGEAPAAPAPEPEPAPVPQVVATPTPVQPAAVPAPQPVYAPAPAPEPEPQAITPNYAPPAPEPAAAAPAPEPAPALPFLTAPVEEEPEPEAAAVAVEQEVRDKMEGHNRVMMALVIGKTAGADVRDANGAAIVEQGQTITMDHAQAAAAAQKLYELWTNAQD